MTPAPRVPRPSRPILLTILVTALLALPMGIVLASHQFSDVPSSNPFHADIDALVDAGVTSGCGGGRYCPKAAVTREQMAAFLNRLGALARGKAPVVNATKVDGYDAGMLIRVSGTGTIGTTTAIGDYPTETGYGPDVAITAPTAGFVVVTAGVTIRNTGCATTCDAFARIKHVQNSDVSTWAMGTVSDHYQSLAVSSVFPVTAGNHTFELLLSREAAGDGTLDGFWGEVTATYSPFGHTGGSTLALPSDEAGAPTK